MSENYKVSDKVRYVIANDYRLLQVMSRFGISLGFGERTIADVCGERGIDAETFVLVINYVKQGGERHEMLRQSAINDFFADLPDSRLRTAVSSLLGYLKATHAYFLDYLFPRIRREMLNAIDCSVKNEVAFLMLKFYDNYADEVRKHMQYEDEVTFGHVERLVAGEQLSQAGHPHLLSSHHSSFEDKLYELKALFVQYYPQQGTSNELNEVLYDLYRAQEDLLMHCKVEDHLFLPAVHCVEQRNRRLGSSTSADAEDNEETDNDVLSAREKEIVVCVAKGMANKEIADKLCLSINTVTTHRRNIARKLSIHSSAGLTIYAIVNKLVSLDEVDV